jgi:hypothetical protein
VAKGDRGLTPKQVAFVAAYLATNLNATKAAIEAGYSAKNADKIGSQLLGKTRVAEAIQAAQAARAEKFEITADQLVRQNWTLANADPNELIQFRRVCCRHCYGINFEYQFTHAEMTRAFRKWEAQQTKNSKEVFDRQGGEGFDRRKPPRDDCPECNGMGDGEVFLHDTRNLSVSARLLYAGVKQTKDGIEIKMHSQQDARSEVAKLLGFYKEKESSVDPAEVARQVREEMRKMDEADGLGKAA